MLNGFCPGWIGKCCHGDDEMNVYRQLCTIVDEWIEIYSKEGRRVRKTIVVDYLKESDCLELFPDNPDKVLILKENYIDLVSFLKHEVLTKITT